MSKAKNKFYELTPRQEQEEKHFDIYKMISEQEKTMDSLLNKYKGDTKEEKMQARGRQSKTLEIKTVTNQSLSRSVGKSRSKIHSSIVDLPAINTGNKHHIKRKKQKLSELKPIPYFQQLKDKKYIEKMKEHLTRAYMNDEVQKLQRSRSKKSFQKTQWKNDSRMTIQKMQSLQQREKSILLETQLNQNKISEKDIPQPLGYIKNIGAEDDEVSSDQGDVPLAYYQREYRGAIRNQCLEETNFLYFSKNQSMKDWTENLLLLFEKHDKELALLRKRCKYLQKFDNSFFSIDIFRND